MVNQIRALATSIERAPLPGVSSDPADDFLFAIAGAGRADYLVTGDKRGVLRIRTHGPTRVVTAAAFVALLD